MLILNIVFIVIISLYLFWIYGLLRALKSDAPYVPMDHMVLRRIMDMVHPQPGDLWIDLGSGDGRVLIEAVKRFKVRGLGIERVGSLRQWSRLLIRRNHLQDKITIKSGNFFNYDLSKADIVTFYLLQGTNDRLVEKLKKEMKPGALGISHRFFIPGVPLIAEDKEYKIYVARF